MASSICFALYGEVKSPHEGVVLSRKLHSVGPLLPAKETKLLRRLSFFVSPRVLLPLCLACLVRAALVRSSHFPSPPYYADYATPLSPQPLRSFSLLKRNNLLAFGQDSAWRGGRLSAQHGSGERKPRRQTPNALRVRPASGPVR